MNEANYYAFAAYLGRGWPRGHNDFADCAQVSRAMQVAAAEAAVRLKQTGAPVAPIFGLCGCFDLVGFSFYSTMGVREGALVPYPPDAPVSPLGYSIWADGLGDGLGRLH